MSLKLFEQLRSKSLKTHWVQFPQIKARIFCHKAMDLIKKQVLHMFCDLHFNVKLFKSTLIIWEPETVVLSLGTWYSTTCILPRCCVPREQQISIKMMARAPKVKTPFISRVWWLVTSEDIQYTCSELYSLNYSWLWLRGSEVGFQSEGCGLSIDH